MVERFTNAEEMARNAGLPDGKSLRSRLRISLPQHHERGSWRVLVGSEKHRAMERELAELLRERGRALRPFRVTRTGVVRRAAQNNVG